MKLALEKKSFEYLDTTYLISGVTDRTEFFAHAIHRREFETICEEHRPMENTGINNLVTLSLWAFKLSSSVPSYLKRTDLIYFFIFDYGLTKANDILCQVNNAQRCSGPR